MSGPRVFLFLLATFAVGCHVGDQETPPHPVPRSGDADSKAELSSAAAKQALDCFERARDAMERGRYGVALLLLEDARRLDPANVRIKELHEEATHLRLVAASSWTRVSFDTSWDSSTAVELAQSRIELEHQMFEITTLLDKGEWWLAETRLQGAAANAARIPGLAAKATKGRVLAEWRERGTHAMTSGNFDAATLSFEFALQGSTDAGDSWNRLSRQVLRRQAQSCRLLAEKSRPCPDWVADARQAPTPSVRGKFPRTRVCPPDPAGQSARRHLAELIRTVARSRIFAMERDNAESDLELALSLEPDSPETSRLRSAIRALPDWEPLCASGESNARIQRAISNVLALQRQATRSESRRDFEAAARLHDEIGTQLRWMPYDTSLERRSQEAKVAAARCRRLAEASGH